MTRADAVQHVAAALDPVCLIVACNGMIGRELYTRADAPTRFYMIGSMGLASSIGLGLALVQPSRIVVVFDGDGNVLMNMSALGSVAAAGASNLFHVVFDNGVHASTGGQRTISDRVRLDDVAKAAGYRRTMRIRDESAVHDATRQLVAAPGPAMLLIEVEPGNVPGIGRVEMTPRALADRFRSAIVDGRA